MIKQNKSEHQIWDRAKQMENFPFVFYCFTNLQLVVSVDLINQFSLGFQNKEIPDTAM